MTERTTIRRIERCASEPAPVKPPLLHRAHAYARSHGFPALVRESFRRYIFSRSPYYIYVCPHTLTIRDVSEPRVDGFHAVMVASNAQADELARTHEDFRNADRNARRGLDRGAVACCLYSDRQVACISWLAATDHARRAIDSIGFSLEPTEAEAWTGRVHTRPEHQRKGLFRYACALRFDYLTALGIEKSSTAVAPWNAPSHVMSAQLGCRLAGKGEVVRLLGRQWWRALQVQEADREAIRRMVDAALSSKAARSQSKQRRQRSPR